MNITIGKFDRATGTVPVTFEENGKSHSRNVNAVIGEGGKYDRAATKARIVEVAQGVAIKFAAGLLGGPEAEA